MGAAGSGKSTILNILGILDDYDSGNYYLAGQLIKNLNETQAAACNNMIGYIFQSFNLINYKKGSRKRRAAPLLSRYFAAQAQRASLGISRSARTERVGRTHAQRNVWRIETTCRHRTDPHQPPANHPHRRADGRLGQHHLAGGNESAAPRQHGDRHNHHLRNARTGHRRSDRQDHPAERRRDRPYRRNRIGHETMRELF